MPTSKLEQLVDKIKYLKSWTTKQVAESIDYSRVHLTKEMKKEESPRFIELLLNKHKDILQDVSKETPPQPESQGLQGEMALIDRLSRNNEKLIDQLTNIRTISSDAHKKSHEEIFEGLQVLREFVLEMAVALNYIRSVAEGDDRLSKMSHGKAQNKKVKEGHSDGVSRTGRKE